MNWLDTISKIGGTATGVIGALGQSSTTRAQANATAAQAAASQQQSKTMLTIALIGGGVLLVIGLFFAFKK